MLFELVREAEGFSTQPLFYTGLLSRTSVNFEKTDSQIA